MSPEQRIPVAVLGATGLVGERILVRLARHPWFRVVQAVASARASSLCAPSYPTPFPQAAVSATATAAPVSAVWCRR